MQEVVKLWDVLIADLDELNLRLQTENERNLEAARQRGNARAKSYSKLTSICCCVIAPARAQQHTFIIFFRIKVGGSIGTPNI
jgi:hypothetical protein